MSNSLINSFDYPFISVFEYAFIQSKYLLEFESFGVYNNSVLVYLLKLLIHHSVPALLVAYFTCSSKKSRRITFKLISEKEKNELRKRDKEKGILRKEGRASEREKAKN